MKDLSQIIPSALYFLVGVISMLMAVKIFRAGKLLPFQLSATGRSWDDIDIKLQNVLVGVLRITGLGFLAIAMLLIAMPVFLYFTSDLYVKYIIPLVALIFCTGLFIINFDLYKKSKTETPWKKSIYAMIIIIVGIVISSLGL